jgi:hypothetical protein
VNSENKFLILNCTYSSLFKAEGALLKKKKMAARNVLGRREGKGV